VGDSHIEVHDQLVAAILEALEFGGLERQRAPHAAPSRVAQKQPASHDAPIPQVNVPDVRGARDEVDVKGRSIPDAGRPGEHAEVDPLPSCQLRTHAEACAELEGLVDVSPEPRVRKPAGRPRVFQQVAPRR